MQETPSVQSDLKNSTKPQPETREVTAGLWKITLPIPFPLKTVNIYAIKGKDGWALIDAGIGTPEARQAFTAGLDQAGLNIKDLRVIILSHNHPDHIGLSGELQEESGARVYTHTITKKGLQAMWDEQRLEFFTRATHFLVQNGMPEQKPWASSGNVSQWRKALRVPQDTYIIPVEDGELLDILGEQYQIIWTPGHADGHICLFRPIDGLFIAADHVLPRITPNIGIFSNDERSNPLGDYLHSLKKVSTLPATLVLPGHGEPFTDLAARTREITEHHRERENQIKHLIEQHPQHAYQIATQVFGPRLKGSDATRLGVAEILSHLEHLRIAGKIAKAQNQDGQIFYANV